MATRPDGRPRSVSQQLYDSIKAQIAAGIYAPGARLASSRALAAELGLSRTTVTAAYDQLVAEGYLETKPGARPRVAPNIKPVPLKTASRRTPANAPPRLSAIGRRIAAANATSWSGAPRPQADFRSGELAGDDFPRPPWKRALMAAAMRRTPRLRYDDPRGAAELRTALQGYLWRARGLRCDVQQIIVVNGSQQALDLCARLLIDPADRVVIENPCYQMARQVFAVAGATLAPIAVDKDGLRTDRLGAIKTARAAFVTPSHQFPLGGVLSVERRQALLTWARRVGAYVIEDDYDGEYRFDTRPIEALQSLDDSGVAIYVGTLSKTLSPLLRLGYLVVPPALADVFAAAKQLADRHTPRLEQAALASLIADGNYERHVRRVRRRNAERRTAALAAITSELGDRVTIAGAAAGLHLVLWFNDIPQRREGDLVTRALAAGIGLHPITPLYDPAAPAERPDKAGIVLGYAALDERTIRHGIRRLATVLDGMA
ncbi:MAG: PLP-dependent aminotransferase family protein [Pseudomonadota bacterium]